MKPTGVIDCPGPEHGSFCITIVGIIPRSSSVGFSLLSSGNCYYKMGTDCYNLTLYSQYRYSELSILSLFILLQDEPS